MNCSVSTSKCPGVCDMNQGILALSIYWLLKFSVMNTCPSTYSSVRFKLIVKLKLRIFKSCIFFVLVYSPPPFGQ